MPAATDALPEFDPEPDALDSVEPMALCSDSDVVSEASFMTFMAAD